LESTETLRRERFERGDESGRCEGSEELDDCVEPEIAFTVCRNRALSAPALVGDKIVQ